MVESGYPEGILCFAGRLRLSVMNSPPRSTGLSPELYISIQSSYSPCSSAVIFSLSVENSLMYKPVITGRVLVFPGVEGATIHLFFPSGYRLEEGFEYCSPWANELMNTFPWYPPA